MFQDIRKEPVKTEEQKLEEKLENSNVIRGFRSMVWAADVLNRHPFSLSEIKGGLIYSDSTTNMKLRRKKIQGQPDQNYLFQAYQTVDNQAVVKGEVEISKNAFPPSLIIAAVAAQLHRHESVETFALANIFLRAASALIQEGEKFVSKRKELNPNANKAKAEVYNLVIDANSNANAMQIVKNIQDLVLGGFSKDKTHVSNFADINQRFIDIRNDVKRGEVEEGYTSQYTQDDVDELLTAVNLLNSSVTDMAFSQGFENAHTIGVEIRQALAEQATLEVEGGEK